MKTNPLFSSALLILTMLASASGEPSKRPYIVIPETTSPDGRYELAWALKEEAGWDWDKINEEKTSLEALPTFKEDDVQEQIVDAKSGKVLTKLACNYYVSPSGNRINHESLEVAWSPDSQYVVVLHQFRYINRSMEAARLKDGDAAGQLDILDQLESALRQNLKKRYGKQYERDKDHLVVSLSDLKAWGTEGFRVTAYSQQPKAPDPEVMSDGALIFFELKPEGKGRLSLKVKSIRETTNEDDSTFATKELVDADAAMNKAYQALRQKLKADQREELKDEQKDWIMTRNAASSSGDRLKIVQKRVEELKARAQ